MNALTGGLVASERGIADKPSGSANAVGADDDSHGLLAGVKPRLPTPLKLPPQVPDGRRYRS